MNFCLVCTLDTNDQHQMNKMRCSNIPKTDFLKVGINHCLRSRTLMNKHLQYMIDESLKQVRSRMP